MAAKRDKAFSKTKGRCAYCGQGPFPTLHLEHIIPKCKGGTDHINNLVAACSRCNGLKGEMNPEQFRHKLITRMDEYAASLESILEIVLATRPHDLAVIIQILDKITREQPVFYAEHLLGKG